MADGIPVKISDEVLREVNELLDWRAVAPLPDGRLLGRPSAGKRERVNPIPDNRIKLLNRLYPLAKKSVLEVGCFEGIHTMGLLTYCPSVTALDVRPVNVVKTLTRLSLSGRSTPVFVANCEDLDESFGRFDAVFHFGVLYHLMRPVEHLRALGRLADTIILDTHFSARNDANMTELIDGETYSYKLVGEQGWGDPFSGVNPTSIHLCYESLKKALISAGFGKIRLLEYRDERNGPRAFLFASGSVDVDGFPMAPEPDL